MRKKTCRFWAFVLFVAALSHCHAQPMTSETPQNPIHEGLVIYEGQYLEPPYEFHWENGLITLNELPMQMPRPGELARRGGERSGRGQRFRMPPNRARAWLERRLSQQSVLLCWADRPAVF